MSEDYSKKRKRVNHVQNNNEYVDTSKPTAVFQPAQGRSHTLTVALPGSIIANAQTHDLKTALAGQIARALAVFCVDEVVVFDDGHRPAPRRQDGRLTDEQRGQLASQDANTGYTAFSDPNHFLYHVLSYMETPPYLRKALFPYHPNLRTAGSLPSLDMPHHLRAEEWCQYREGVTLEQSKGGFTGPNSAPVNHTGKANKNHSSATQHTFVDAGFPAPIKIPVTIPPNTRVTLKFPSANDSIGSAHDLHAEAVSAESPREEAGYYWGFNVRLAKSLSAVFTESPFEDGYDYSIGMSERGRPLRDLVASKNGGVAGVDHIQVPQWKHMLVTFGGLAGLEKALSNDAELTSKGVTDASELFDAWVNLVEGQGSRTIRTEEAVWIGLMGIAGLVRDNRETNL